MNNDPANAPPAERQLRVGTSAVSIVEAGHGNGPPLVLLHGSGSSNRVFARQMSARSRFGCRVIAIDLPGHGRSGNAADPASDYSVTGFADCVEAVLDRLQIGRAAILGWSLGGHVGIELLARGRAAGLLLCGAAPVVPSLFGLLRGFQPSFDILLASKETFTRADAKRFEALCFGSASDSAFLDAILRTDGRVRTVFPKSLLRPGGANQRDAVLGAPEPVGLVNGSLDPFVRLAYLAGLILRQPFGPGAHVIEGAGHAPFWSHADEFNDLLQRFVAQVARSESAAAAQPKLRHG